MAMPTRTARRNAAPSGRPSAQRTASSGSATSGNASFSCRTHTRSNSAPMHTFAVRNGSRKSDHVSSGRRHADHGTPLGAPSKKPAAAFGSFSASHPGMCCATASFTAPLRA